MIIHKYSHKKNLSPKTKSSGWKTVTYKKDLVEALADAGLRVPFLTILLGRGKNTTAHTLIGTVSRHDMLHLIKSLTHLESREPLLIILHLILIRDLYSAWRLNVDRCTASKLFRVREFKDTIDYCRLRYQESPRSLVNFTDRDIKIIYRGKGRHREIKWLLRNRVSIYTIRPRREFTMLLIACNK